MCRFYVNSSIYSAGSVTMPYKKNETVNRGMCRIRKQISEKQNSAVWIHHCSEIRNNFGGI